MQAHAVTRTRYFWSQRNNFTSNSLQGLGYLSVCAIASRSSPLSHVYICNGQRSSELFCVHCNFVSGFGFYFLCVHCTKCSQNKEVSSYRPHVSWIGRTRNCSRQFTWRLHSMVVILAQLVTAWFIQRDGTAGIHRSKTIFHCYMCALLILYVQLMNVILDCSIDQSMRRACPFRPPFCWTPR
jgi:hypothetical protein